MCVGETGDCVCGDWGACMGVQVETGVCAQRRGVTGGRDRGECVCVEDQRVVEG